jgi:hypothetical protein
MSDRNTDWLSNNNEALCDQIGQTMAYLADPDNVTRMGLSGFKTWIEGTLKPAADSFKAAFEDYKDPAERTQVKTAVLRTAKEILVPLYRHLYVGMLKNNPLVTDADLVSMGLPKRSGGGRKPPVIPLTAPAATVKTPEPGVVEIHYRDDSVDNASRAKPRGVHGAEFIWAVLDEPPLNWAQLIHSTFDTATPLRFTFEGEQRGKRLYFAIRWENTRGLKGPWSDIRDAIIP